MEFFATNAPDRLHWTLNSYIVVFHSVWVHFGLFHYCTKLGAKRAELVQLRQKFFPRSRIGIFRNECTQSTPLDPKLTFWRVSYYLGAFGTTWLPYKTRCKTCRTRAKVRATKSRRIFRKERTRSTPFDPKLKFWCITLYLGAFGNVSLVHKTRYKTGCTGAINAQVCAMKLFWNFSQRTHPIHPIGP